MESDPGLHPSPTGLCATLAVKSMSLSLCLLSESRDSNSPVVHGMEGGQDYEGVCEVSTKGIDP